MAKKKEAKSKERPRIYEGYDIHWLKFEASENHPDKSLVAEYEAKYGEVE